MSTWTLPVIRHYRGGMKTTFALFPALCATPAFGQTEVGGRVDERVFIVQGGVATILYGGSIESAKLIPVTEKFAGRLGKLFFVMILKVQRGEQRP